MGMSDAVITKELCMCVHMNHEGPITLVYRVIQPSLWHVYNKYTSNTYFVICGNKYILSWNKTNSKMYIINQHKYVHK